MTNQKIMVGIDNEMVELVGEDKSAFLADRAIILEKEAKIKAEAEAKAEAKAAAQAKLAALGLTVEDLQALGL